MRLIVVLAMLVLLSASVLAGASDEGYHNTLYANTIRSTSGWGTVSVIGTMSTSTISSSGSITAQSSITGWNVRGNNGVHAGSMFLNGGTINIPNLLSSSQSGMADVQYDGRYIRQRTSSAKYKDDIRDLSVPTETILRLRAREFVDKRTGQDSVGLIAEEVHETGLTSLVYYKDGAPESVSYSELAVYLLPVIKEQQARLDAQHEELASQGERIRALENRLAALES